MKTWEYQNTFIDVQPRGDREKEEETYLNKMGELGWEMAEVRRVEYEIRSPSRLLRTHFTFKREKISTYLECGITTVDKSVIQNCLSERIREKSPRYTT